MVIENGGLEFGPSLIKSKVLTYHGFHHHSQPPRYSGPYLVFSLLHFIRR